MEHDKLLKELRRCEEAIHAAETMLAENLYAESISRAYYAIIHAVMILLALAGHETRHPDEAEHLFTADFVRDHGLDDGFLDPFEAVRRARKSASHYFLVKYSGGEVSNVLQQARTFLDLTRQHLEQNG